MNSFSDLANSLKGQLGDFSNSLRGSRSSMKSQSRARGGEKGELIPSGYRRGKLNEFTPEQMDLFQEMFSNVGPDSYLSRLAGGDEDLFNEMEAPAFRQFNALQGNLASRFSGMGMGARNSSGFQNTSNQAASDFSQDLQSRRQDLQRQAILDLQGISRELLGQKPYKNFLIKKDYPQQQTDQSGDILGGLLSGLAGGASGFATGGMTGAIGGAGSGFYKGYRGGY